jgi:signal transduction histidine kinase
MDAVTEGSERELEPLLELQHRRLVLLEEILGGVTTATIVYDAFGRVLQVNQQMVKLLKAARLSTTDTSPLDLISRLTDAPPERVRRYLRHIVLEHGTISVPTRPSADGKRFLLYISSIEHIPQRGRESIEPLSMFRAILCELIDITALERIYAMRELLSEQMSHRVRNSLAAMFAAADLLADARLSGAQHERVLDNLRRALQTSKEAFDTFEGFLDQPLVVDIAERHPVDARAVVLDGLAAIRDEAQRLHVRIEPDIPEFVSLVIAGSQELGALTRTILLLLTHDAREGGSVRVSMSEGDSDVVIEFSNEGFGLPDERLQEYLHGSGEPQSSAFRMIRLGFKDAERWGGRFEVQSPLGQGFRCILTLRKVM